MQVEASEHAHPPYKRSHQTLPAMDDGCQAGHLATPERFVGKIRNEGSIKINVLPAPIRHHVTKRTI
jgi:hypothetical protein